MDQVFFSFFKEGKILKKKKDFALNKMSKLCKIAGLLCVNFWSFWTFHGMLAIQVSSKSNWGIY